MLIVHLEKDFKLCDLLMKFADHSIEGLILVEVKFLFFFEIHMQNVNM